MALSTGSSWGLLLVCVPREQMLMHPLNHK